MNDAITTQIPDDTSSRATADLVARELNQLLADSYALMAQTHLAHWNVEGSDFFQLHEAFQAQYEELFTAIDEIAERVRTLGAYAEGGLRRLADLADVTEMKAPLTGRDFVTGLLTLHEKLLVNARELRGHAGEFGDPETEDLVIARIKQHEKTIWMLKSYLN